MNAYSQFGAMGLLVSYLFYRDYKNDKNIKEVTNRHREERGEWRMQSKEQTDKTIEVLNDIKRLIDK